MTYFWNYFSSRYLVAAMKKLSEFFKKKQETVPLFQIRRHIFDYVPDTTNKKRKRKKIYYILLSLSIFRLSMTHFRVILVVSMVLIISLTLLLIANLKVQHIYITRENSLIDINEAYRNLEYLREKNLFTIQKEQITKRLQSSQEVIQEARITRKFPRSLEVHIIAYTPLFESSEGLIMSSGNIFINPWKRRNDISWLDIVWYEPTLLGSGPDISLSDLEHIIQLITELEKNIIGFEIYEKKYYTRERELHLRDQAGTIYIFDLTHPIELQSEKLAIYFREKLKNPSVRDMMYIDVRVPRGLFLCPMSKENICLQNLRSIYGENADLFTSKDMSPAPQEQ